MTDAKALDCDDIEEVKGVLLGRRIVSVERGKFQAWRSLPETNYITKQAEGRLVLDDGTELYVIPARDCCSYWDIEHLAGVENVITAVRVVSPDLEGTDGNDGTPYSIYVVADATEVNILTVDGSPGNWPYYATGYSLIVVPANKTEA